MCPTSLHAYGDPAGSPPVSHRVCATCCLCRGMTSAANAHVTHVPASTVFRLGTSGTQHACPPLSASPDHVSTSRLQAAAPLRVLTSPSVLDKRTVALASDGRSPRTAAGPPFLSWTSALSLGREVQRPSAPVEASLRADRLGGGVRSPLSAATSAGCAASDVRAIGQRAAPSVGRARGRAGVPPLRRPLHPGHSESEPTRLPSPVPQAPHGEAVRKCRRSGVGNAREARRSWP